ncbi:MAG: PP2C family protein-serine/threonine phosphatase [Geminicoccaceae bacterium]
MIAFRSALRSHVGHVRELNEDSAAALPERGLWVVADGMGGHERGDHASRLVTSSLARMPPTDGAVDLLRLVQATLASCNRELHEEAAKDGLSGCTVVVLLAAEGHIACLWAGDSRLYRLRAGRLERLTQDHSVVQELIDQGEIATEAARDHPWRNRITRAVGIDERLELDALQDRVLPGDRYLLCSDGLTGELTDEEIAGLLAGPTADAAAERLLELTLTRAARDNVTLIVVEPQDDPDRTFPQAAGEG